MRLRNLVVLGLVGWLAYRMSPPERRRNLGGRLRELGRVAVVTIVVYWIWILASWAWREWT